MQLGDLNPELLQVFQIAVMDDILFVFVKVRHKLSTSSEIAILHTTVLSSQVSLEHRQPIRIKCYAFW